MSRRFHVTADTKVKHWKWEITPKSWPGTPNENIKDCEKDTFSLAIILNRSCPIVTRTLSKTGFKTINKWWFLGKPPQNTLVCRVQNHKPFFTYRFFFKNIIAFAYWNGNVSILHSTISFYLTKFNITFLSFLACECRRNEFVNHPTLRHSSTGIMGLDIHDINNFGVFELPHFHIAMKTKIG